MTSQKEILAQLRQCDHLQIGSMIEVLTKAMIANHVRRARHLKSQVRDLLKLCETAGDYYIDRESDFRGTLAQQVAAVRALLEPIDLQTPLEDLSQAFAEAAVKPPVPQTERCGEKA